MDRNLSCLSCALTILGLALIRPPRTYGQVSVLTYHNDNARSGQNTNETILAPSNVNSSQFAKVFSHSVDGFIVGQPLYLQNVSVSGSGLHNVVYVATLHDSVYAFDADNNTAPLWTVSFINPGAGVTSVPVADAGCGGVTGFTEHGVVGTPVIDPIAGTLFVIAKTKENGNYVQRLHALDVGTGTEKLGGPVTIAAKVNGSGDGSTTVSFDPLRNMSRTGLLLDNRFLYATFGSNGCKSITNRGWVIVYSVFALRSLGVFSTAPNSTYAAIWQSGSGAAADASGNVFFETGDGLFDVNTGGPDFGDSILKMSLSGGRLSVTDYFTPFNQAVYNQNDLDLGSVGPLLLPDQPGNHPHLLVGSGKDQTIYLVDRDNMGHFNPVDNSQIVQTVAAFSSTERSGAPAYWNGLLYFVQALDSVIAYSLSGGLLSNRPVSQTPRAHPWTGPPSVSASGTNNGILWFISRTDSSAGTLHAFDATNLSTELYNSDQAGVRDTLGPVAHFAVPTIANGKVYVGTQSELVVYGLTGPAAALSPLTLTFANQPVGTTSAPQAITLTNAGAAPLAVSGIAVGPNFTQTNSCGASVPAGAKCAISIAFAPTSSGNLTGTLTIADNASGSPQTVPLSGTAADFSLSPASGSSTSQTVTPGQSATYTLNLSPAGGFNQAVSLSCTGAPAQSTCSVSPSTITPGGTTPVPVTVTVSTTAPSAAPPRVHRTPPPLKRLPQVLWFIGVASLLGFLTGSRWLAGAGRDAPKHEPSGPSRAVGVVTLLVLLWTSCGGGGMGRSSNPGTPAGTYTLTVTAVSISGSASLMHDLKLSLTVQ